ncbi:hypothetical protein [Saccharopolyspora shandongensis]|uniref:hypothetical protein n=1 Tax=Saccharopolyspora shandongensis TaxID=418495 RepID=UPI00115F8B33|nr:hypothetical protein [Saccharopolyspora shandongensis]
MIRNSHCAWKWPVIGLLTTALMFTGGCGVPSIEPYTMPTTSDDMATINPPRPSGPPPGPVKYAFAAFKSCQEIQQAVPDLPPPLRPQRGEELGRFSQTCTFTTSKDDGSPFIAFRVELFENRQDDFGFHSGAELAKTGFSVSVSPGDEKDGRVGIGSEAQWADPGAGVSCSIEVLDENAVMITSYNSGAGHDDPRSEQCREGAREVAKKIYAAVQPR